MSAGVVCMTSDFHPYECGGPKAGCSHCNSSASHKRRCVMCACARSAWDSPHAPHKTEYVCDGCGLFFCPQDKRDNGGHRTRYGLWGMYRCRGTLHRWREGNEHLTSVRNAAVARMRAKQPRGDSILQAVGE